MRRVSMFIAELIYQCGKTYLGRLSAHGSYAVPVPQSHRQETEKEEKK